MEGAINSNTGEVSMLYVELVEIFSTMSRKTWVPCSSVSAADATTDQ